MLLGINILITRTNDYLLRKKIKHDEQIIIYYEQNIKHHEYLIVQAKQWKMDIANKQVSIIEQFSLQREQIIWHYEQSYTQIDNFTRRITGIYTYQMSQYGKQISQLFSPRLAHVERMFQEQKVLITHAIYNYSIE